MKVTVTGGAGFIGSHLVEKLLALGHEVLTVDISPGMGYLEAVMDHPRHTFIQGSVLDRKLIRHCIQQSDIVYHLAAVLGVKNCIQDPLKMIEVNFDGTRLLLREAYKHGVKVVFASTSEVYGKNPSVPFSEDSDRVLGSTHVNRWSYATAKGLDEHLCFAYMEKGLPVTILRYFNAYGPRQSAAAGMVIPRFIQAALGNEQLHIHGSGNQQRCFTYVDDIVTGTVLAAKPEANGGVFNIGSHYEITIRDLADKIRKLVSSTSPIIETPYEMAYGKGYEDMLRRIPDLTRAMKILGYQPSVDLERGLLKTIAWFMAAEQEERK